MNSPIHIRYGVLRKIIRNANTLHATIVQKGRTHRIAYTAEMRAYRNRMPAALGHLPGYSHHMNDIRKTQIGKSEKFMPRTQNRIFYKITILGPALDSNESALICVSISVVLRFIMAKRICVFIECCRVAVASVPVRILQHQFT